MTMVTSHDSPDAALRLAAGRVRAAEKMPYLRTGLFAIKPVERPGLGTVGVDKRWRLYWDPAFIARCSVDECAAAWLHEVGHLLREHATRFDALLEPQERAKVFNWAGDCAINADLRTAGIALPDDESRWYPEKVPGAEGNMTAEQYYRLLVEDAEQQNRCPACGESLGPQEPGDEGQDGDTGDGSAESENQSSDDAASGQDAGNESGQSPDDSGDSNSGGSGNTEGASGSQQGAPDSGTSSGEPGQPGSGSAGGDQADAGQGGNESNEPTAPGGNAGYHHCPGTHQPHADDCGSGAGGTRREWEEPDSNTDDGSVDAGRANLIRQQVARDIQQASKSRGSIPGGWERWADEVVSPKVDWRKQLTIQVRRTTATVAGLRDYTYSKPSRRSSAVPYLVLPAMRKPRPPKVRIVLDTSGSVDDRKLAQALAEIATIVTRVAGHGGDAVEVISCDIAATTAQAIRKVKDLSLVGGGGTDMRVGIAVAAENKPRADMIITMTDGETPWPSEPPDTNPTAKYLALIIGAESSAYPVPEWMTRIVVDETR